MNGVLVSQSFGNEAEYRRAIFMIWSFWALCSKFSKVLLFTDNDEFFKPFFRGRPVDFVILSSEKIKSMRGEIDFLHRMKIALIEESFALTDSTLLYVDSDTFFTGDPSTMVEAVSGNKSFMHLREYRFDSLKDLRLPAAAPFRAFLDLINARSFVSGAGEAISVTPRHYSWNAGAIILHPEHRHRLSDVYTLTEEFYSATKNHASEQYAFSIVLQNSGDVLPCDSAIYHYWHRVKKQAMDMYLRKHISDQWSMISFEEKLAFVREQVKLLPSFFDNHVLSFRDKAIQAFHENRFKDAWGWVLKAMLKAPWEKTFAKDILYHGKRNIQVLLKNWPGKHGQAIQNGDT